MKIIEREIKILSHVNEIEFILDALGITSKIEIQQVLSVRIGQESHKLKIKKSPDGGVTEYLFSKKCQTKVKHEVVNKNFSNKLEEEIIMTETEFNISQKLFRKMFENHKMMDYEIEKKRYNTFKGYNIDICRIIKVNDKSEYYMDRFIEIEETVGEDKDKLSLDQLIQYIIPNETNILAVNCGMRNLNRIFKRTSIIQAKNTVTGDINEK